MSRCGGSSTTLNFSAGYVAVSYQGQTGVWFDNFNLICRDLLSDGSLGATATTVDNGTSKSGTSSERAPP